MVICNCSKELGRKVLRMVTAFDIFWIIASSSLSTNANFASISTAAVHFCLIGEYLDMLIGKYPI